MNPTKDGFSGQMSQTALPKGVVPPLSFKSVERFIMKYAKASNQTGPSRRSSAILRLAEESQGDNTHT